MPHLSKEALLKEVHAQIDECRICEDYINPFRKPLGLDRGDAGQIVVVGEGPGKSEESESRAFAGPAGRILEQWLIKCGASPQNIRAGIYFTSVTKCVKNGANDLSIMKSNCRTFLDKQLNILKPSLVISLGAHAFSSLKFTEEPFSSAIGRIFFSGDHLLISPYDHHFHLVVWPHPSPSNRWLNDSQNKKKLMDSFNFIYPFFNNLNK